MKRLGIFGGDNISKAASAHATIDSETSKETFRKPSKSDGAEVWELIKSTKVLDLNSSYSYLMWCTYFSDTSIIVEVDKKVVGFISGFINPTSPDRLFVWQVAVAESQRGKGLASKMLMQLLKRDSCKDVQYIETTVTPSNIPSQKLFQGIARDLETEINVSEFFSSSDFPEKGVEDEMMHEIGPFKIS